MYYTIYNPLTANGKGIELLDKFKSIYSKQFQNIIYVNTLETEYDNFSKNLTPEDNIIILGGDGTVNIFINRYKKYNLECDVFLFAPEYGNDFIKDINAKPYTLINITKYLINLPYTIIDNEKFYFLNNVGYGLDGRCCHIAEEKKKNHKRYSYQRIAAKLLFTYKKKKATVIIDGQTYQFKNIFLVGTFNSKYYGGGIKAAPTQDRNNDKLTVMAMFSKTHIGAASIFKKIIKGEHLKFKNKVQVLSGNSITVRFNKPEYIQVDGEIIGEVYEYSAVKEEIKKDLD